MTPQGEALLARIASHPDDDAAYLVYADWLGTQGDPHGELIVLMHQHSRATDDTHRAQLGSALAAYYTKHRSVLFGDLGKHPGIAWDFDLGFLRSVSFLPERNDRLPTVCAAICELPISRFLRELVVFTSDARSHESVTAAVAAVKPTTLPAVTFAKQYKTIEDATAGPDARWLIASVGNELPPELLALTNLEWLELRSSSSPFTALSPEIGTLAKLRRLEVDFCYQLASLPEELFAIESLQYLSMYDCMELRGEYHMGRINNLLGGFVRAKTPARRRVIELSLLLGRSARVQKLATRADLLAALDSNVGDVRGAALTSLARMLPDPFEQGFELGAAPAFAVLGKLNFDRKQIAAKLGERGAAVTSKIDDATTHVVLGESPAGKHAALGDRPIVLEQHLKALFAAAPVAAPVLSKIKKQAPIAPALDMRTIRTYLRSRDDAKTAAAIAALKDGEVSQDLLVELLVVVQDVSLGKSRDAAKKLFALVAPASLADATRAHLKSSLLLESLGETKRADRIVQFCRAAKVIDPMQLALLLVDRARVGLGYIFANGKSDEITTALHALVARSDDRQSLDLAGRELYTVPDEVRAIPCTSLRLHGNHLRAFPEPVLAIKKLAHLDLSANRVLRLPDAIAKLPLVTLNLSGNHMRFFPKAVLGLAGLQQLDLSSARDYTGNESRITGLPDEIRRLAALRRLAYRFNILEELPDGLYALELEELDFKMCQLPGEIPDRLRELKKLKRLDLRSSSWWERRDEVKKLLPKVSLED